MKKTKISKIEAVGNKCQKLSETNSRACVCVCEAFILFYEI